MKIQPPQLICGKNTYNLSFVVVRLNYLNGMSITISKQAYTLVRYSRRVIDNDLESRRAFEYENLFTQCITSHTTLWVSQDHSGCPVW